MYNGNFTSPIDAPDLSATTDIVCQWNSFQKLFQNSS